MSSQLWDQLPEHVKRAAALDLASDGIRTRDLLITNQELTGDLVIVHPDERTSFKAVLQLLRRIKSAGVRMFSVVSP